MKRTRVLLLAWSLVVLTACGGNSSSAAPLPGSSTGGAVPNGSVMPAPGGESAANGSSYAPNSTDRRIRTGLGVVATVESSTAATAEKAGRAQTTVTICALSIDEADVILSAKFDTLESKLDFNHTGAFTGDLATPLQSKKELGDAYGMKAASPIGKEWYEQIDALERWMAGKSVRDVLEMKVTQRDEAHTHIPDEPELKTSVTISLTDQLHALEKAFSDAK